MPEPFGDLEKMKVTWARELAEGRPLAEPWVFAYAHMPVILGQMHTCPVTFSGHVSLVSPTGMDCGTGETPVSAGWMWLVSTPLSPGLSQERDKVETAKVRLGTTGELR